MWDILLIIEEDKPLILYIDIDPGHQNIIVFLNQFTANHQFNPRLLLVISVSVDSLKVIIVNTMFMLDNFKYQVR